ncbi:MAG: EutN/CcmL family microcompartment protein [Candidatus Sumerlaeia bacterium]|nr:EutN/CcmL family microcompartment protein [Candidatus Sumerlaeia bacterium]
MDIARVVGKYVCTRKDPALEGVTILLIQPLDGELKPVGSPLVATDATGLRNMGEIVYYVASGDAVYTAPDGRALPVDAAIVGIVDKLYYRKEYSEHLEKKKS